jgi:predicted phage-related endonuclease
MSLVSRAINQGKVLPPPTDCGSEAYNQLGIPLLGDLGYYVIPEDKGEWLRLRRSSFGGSEAAALLGLSKYDGKWTLWAKKVGAIPLDTSTSEPAEFGHFVEHYLLQKAHAYLNRSAPPHVHWVVIGFNHTFIMKGAPHISYSPDGLAIPYELNHDNLQWEANPEGSILLECKAGSAWDRNDWYSLDKLGVPIRMERNKVGNYYCQVQQGMLVLPYAERAMFCVLLDNRPHFFKIDQKPHLQADIISAAGEMWNRVLHKEPPDVDDRDEDALKLVRREGVVDATNFSDVAEEYLRANEEKLKWEKKAKELRNLLISKCSMHQSVNLGVATGYWQSRKGGIDLTSLEERYPLVAEKFRKKPTTFFVIRGKKNAGES